jgi:hypothetical protein
VHRRVNNELDCFSYTNFIDKSICTQWLGGLFDSEIIPQLLVAWRLPLDDCSVLVTCHYIMLYEELLKAHRVD